KSLDADASEAYEALPALAAMKVVEAEPAQPLLSAEEQARTFYELGDYVRAAETLLATLASSPENAPAMALLARVRANEGDLQEALEWCGKAVMADKLNPGWHYLLGAILQEGDRFQEAAASLQRALYLDQDFVLAHFALGNLRQRQGLNRESVRHFENALRAL